MAGMNVSLQRTMSRRVSDAAVRAPRFVMSWEDWLTLGAALICFITIGVSIQQAHWVARMPPVVPTAMAGLLIGLAVPAVGIAAAIGVMLYFVGAVIGHLRAGDSTVAAPAFLAFMALGALILRIYSM